MRQIPLYALTVFVAAVLIFAFVAPFRGGMNTETVPGGTGEVVPENFDLPDSMQDGGQATPSADQPPVADDAGKDARQVDPDSVPSSDDQTTPLQRVAPRQELGELGQAKPASPPPPPVPVDATAKPMLLYRPVATAAGTIEVSGYKIVLEGIDEVPPEQTCSLEGSPSWPCGMAARTAFRNWLRQRAIECVVPGQPADQVIATRCTLGNSDLASWLVENGWARAKDGTALADRMKEAEEAKRGIFGSPPPALPITQELPLPSFSDGGNALPQEAPQAAPPPAAQPPIDPNAPFPPRPQ